MKAGQALNLIPCEQSASGGVQESLRLLTGFYSKGFHMLVLARNFGQEVIVTIGEHKMVIKVIEMTGKQVKLGFTSSREVRIDRKEIHDSIMETGFNPEAFPIAPLVPGVVRLGERLPGQLMRTK